MKTVKNIAALSMLFILVGSLSTTAQNNNTAFGDELNVVTTGVPILMISPGARGGGMGDAGVAALPDLNSNFWNPSKLAFLEPNTTSLGISYTPWLQRLVPDINMAYLSFQKSIGNKGRQGIGASLRYFSLGDINFKDEQGNSNGTFSPYEFMFDVAYALKFSETWSGGIGLRYIYSDLTQGQAVAGLQSKPGQSVAADISFFYKGRPINMKKGQKGIPTFGINISNIGSKISYTESGKSDFIPTNLKIGGGYLWQFDKYNKIGFYLDLNKLLVPTPPVREGDSGHTGDVNENGTPNDGEVIAGKDDEVDPLSGMIQSLSPSAKPGGFKELMHEIVYNVGAEYTYNDLFIVRAGYQHEHETKGNRKYFTLGAGIKYNIFELDVAYLIPANSTVKSPLESTLRFTLGFDLGGMAKAD